MAAPMPLALLAELVARDAPKPDGLHDEAHRFAVAATALDLARQTPGADVELAVLFGLLHDARRPRRPSSRVRGRAERQWCSPARARPSRPAPRRARRAQ
jgi:hypothetical protein